MSSDLLMNAHECVGRVLQECNGSYRCEMGVSMGIDQQGTNQAKRICHNFQGLNTCVPEQTCIGIQGSTYKSCIAASQCLQTNPS